jgi:hypothetical protein
MLGSLGLVDKIFKFILTAEELRSVILIIFWRSCVSRIFLCFFIVIGFFSNEIFSLDQDDEFVRSSSFEKKIAEIDEAILREMQQIQDLQGAYGLTDEVL